MDTSCRPGKDSPPITTTRLLLRRMSIQDYKAVRSLRCNPKVFYWRDPVDTPAQAFQWLQDRLADPASLSYSVSLLPNQQEIIDSHIIGFVGATRLPEVGYMYDPSVWGKGYATEALRAWIESYWQTWPMGHPATQYSEMQKCLTAVTGSENGAASRRVLEKCGFKHETYLDVHEDRGSVTLDVWKLEKPDD
ncbi:MAG: hypothetical protein Q9163_004446 [Psora crenata]